MSGSSLRSAAALLLALGLAGCSGGVPSELAKSVSQSQSAVQTARLALAQQRGGRVLHGVASTAFEDMLREAQDAEATAAGSPATASERALRNRVLRLLHASTEAVLAGQDAAEHVPGAPSVAVAMRRIDGVLARLQAEQRRLGSGR